MTLEYSIKAESVSGNDAVLTIKQSDISFGTTEKTSDLLPNPAELFLGSFAACILKNVERFSHLLNYSFTKAEISVTAVRLERPPRMDSVHYKLTVYSNDKRMRTELLKKNLEKFGTIFNTVSKSCKVTGKITKVS